jgi:hypothetical protein
VLVAAAVAASVAVAGRTDGDGGADVTLADTVCLACAVAVPWSA